MKTERQKSRQGSDEPSTVWQEQPPLSSSPPTPFPLSLLALWASSLALQPPTCLLPASLEHSPVTVTSWTCPAVARAGISGQCPGCSRRRPHLRLRSRQGWPSSDASGSPRTPAPWLPFPLPLSPPSSSGRTTRAQKTSFWGCGK